MCKPGVSMRIAAVAALLVFSCQGCGDDETPTKVPRVAPQGGLGFAYVDVAQAWGYTLRNRSGSDNAKDYILEAMPPGIAVADFDGDGWYDLYCPNGNKIIRYDPKTEVVTLYPESEAPRNELYWNRGGERFEAGGKAAGVDDPLWAFGAVAADVDNDGDADIYVCNWGVNRLYRNDGKGRFTEVAAEAGVQGDGAWSTGPCFFDYDNDGDLDLYVAQYADMADMLRRKDITTHLPDGRVSGKNCDWKTLKVYCGPRGLRPLNDVLFKNLLMETGKLRFEDVSKPAGIWIKHDEHSATGESTGPYYGFQPVAWDIDGNGWQDVFVANDTHYNLCWMNQGDGTFRNDALHMGLAMSQSDHVPQASMGVAVGDINLDGGFDIAMSEFSHDQFNLLLGHKLESGIVIFDEMASTRGLREMTFLKLGWGTLLFDPDLDGDQDIFFSNGHVFPEVANLRDLDTTYRQTNLLILNEKPSWPKLRDVSSLAGPGLAIEKCSRGAVQIDIDNDGDPDIATSELNDVPCLLRCDLAAPRHWLAVLLTGNPKRKVPLDPAGAVVSVGAGGATQKKLLLIGSSFLSSEDPRLLFGLGSLEKADFVEVAWPNGQKTRLSDVAADQLLKIRLSD
jgi:hypothetical protein